MITDEIQEYRSALNRTRSESSAMLRRILEHVNPILDVEKMKAQFAVGEWKVMHRSESRLIVLVKNIPEGFRINLHDHPVKETVVVTRGKIRMLEQANSVTRRQVVGPGETSQTIEPNVLHSCYWPEETDLYFVWEA